MQVLGIETSCDETAMAIYDENKGLLSHKVSSQHDIHKEYGGVVPELASRDHIKKLIPILSDLLKDAKTSMENIDGIAYTKGPGLIGALLVGSSFAKALGYALSIPTLGIHHMEGHLLAPMLETPIPEFPFIALLVSGGHSLLIKVSDIGDYQRLGETLDDAVGEAFDKTAKLLGLNYPGGPEIEKLAKQGNPDKYKFPRPLLDRKSLDFSFSGLKTFAVNTYKNSKQTKQTKADIARAFQDAVIETLCTKCKWALMQNKLNSLVIAGGVGANQTLRDALQQMTENLNAKLYYPKLEFCTDNGAMIAFAGYQRFKKEQRDLNLAIEVKPRWDIGELE